MSFSLRLSLSLSLSLAVSFCWSGHVSWSLWSNVRRVTSLSECSLVVFLTMVTYLFTHLLTQWQGHQQSCLGTAKKWELRMQRWIVYRGRRKIHLTASILCFYFIFYLFILVLKKREVRMQQWIVYRGRRKINLTASILSFYLIFYLVLLVFLKERGENATVDCLSRKAEDQFNS